MPLEVALEVLDAERSIVFSKLGYDPFRQGYTLILRVE